MEDFTQKTKDLLETIPYITIATVTPDGLPYNSPVFAVHDDEYNFFWNSSKDSQHSKNISAQGNVFLVVYDSSVKAGEAFGIYMEAEANELSGEELEHGIKTFFSKIGREPKPAEFFLGENTQRMYKATPKKIWINRYDKTKTPPDWKEEVKLID